MGKHKSKNPDFQKVKLRVGRKLPRGENVTDTSFKAKKIKLHEQLKDVGQQLTKEQHLKALLSTLGNLNILDSHKTKALHELGEYISLNHDEFIFNISEILDKVLTVIRIPDGNVRRAAVSVMKTIILKAEEQKLKPFYVLITTCLCSALWQGSINLKRDIMKFIDFFLKEHPTIICHSMIIVNQYLDMISRKTEKRGKKNPIGKRKLIDYHDENMTSQEWRFVVLNHLNKFLITRVKQIEKNITKKKEPVVIAWDVKDALHIPLYGYRETHVFKPPAPEYSHGIVFEGWKDKDALQDFASGLMYVLHESFVEVISEFKSRNNKIKQITAKGCSNILCIVELMYYLGKWLILIESEHPGSQLISWFQKEFDKWVFNVSEGFPYQLADVDIDIGNENQFNKYENDRVKLNFYIFRLNMIFVFRTAHPKPFFGTQFHSFYVSMFDSKFIENSITIQAVLDVTKDLLDYAVANKGEEEMIDLCFNSLIEYADELSVNNENKRQILLFVLDIGINYKYRHLLELYSLNYWLGKLIDNVEALAMTNLPTTDVFTTVCKLASQNIPVFMNLLTENCEKILSFLEGGNSELQNVAVHLIGYMGEIDKNVLKPLLGLFSKPSIDLKYVKHIIYFLNNRLQTWEDANINFEDYLVFMFNLCAGTYIKQNNMDEKMKTYWLSFRTFCNYCICPSEGLERHVAIKLACVQCLQGCLRQVNILELVARFVIQLTNQYCNMKSQLPIHTALSVVEMCAKLVTLDDKRVQGIRIRLATSCLYYAMMVERGVDNTNCSSKQSKLSNIFSCLSLKGGLCFSVMKHVFDTLHEKQHSRGDSYRGSAVADKMAPLGENLTDEAIIYICHMIAFVLKSDYVEKVFKTNVRNEFLRLVKTRKHLVFNDPTVKWIFNYFSEFGK